jgi:hypothetical protein
LTVDGREERMQLEELARNNLAILARNGDERNRELFSPVSTSVAFDQQVCSTLK